MTPIFLPNMEALGQTVLPFFGAETCTNPQEIYIDRAVVATDSWLPTFELARVMTGGP